MKKQGKENRVIIILLSVILLILILGMIFLFYRYEKLEDKYERGIESQYNIDNFDIDDDDDDDKEDNNVSDKTTKKATSVSFISRDKALKIALKDMKLSQSDVYDIDVEFENKTTHGNYVYEITFDYKNYEYEYFVSAKTGKILASFQSRD